MFSFLNAAILYALPVIAIPLLIHLFTRQKLKKIYFSSLEFLKEMRKEKIRRVKIKQILLIIIRTLIILMIIFAFTRPTLKAHRNLGSEGGSARSSIVIILDNSLSMARTIKGVPCFDLAKKRAFELVNILHPGDEVFIIYPLNSGEERIIGPKYSFESIKQTIHETKLSYHATDIIDALHLAQETLSGASNINREIYLISDLQANAFTLRAEQSDFTLSSGLRLFVLPLETASSQNFAVQEISLLNQIIEKGKTAELNVKVTNFSDSEISNKLVQLFLQGKRSARKTISLKAKASQIVNFKFTPDQTGFQQGSVLLEEDALGRDNRRFFSFFVPPEINILLVGKQLHDTQYFQWALSPTEKFSATFKPHAVRAEQLSQTMLAKYHVIILSNIPRLRPDLQEKLVEYVRQGGGLIVTLGSDVDLREYNAHFNNRLNLPPFTESVGRIGTKDAFVSLGKIDFSHPVFHNLFDQQEKHIDSPKFYFLFKVAKATHTASIISYNNNYPFLLETQVGRGRVFLFTSAVDPGWSDWALKGIFAPLVNRCVSYLAGASQLQADELLVGEEIQFSGPQEKQNWDMKIQTPDNRSVKLRPTIKRNNVEIRFQHTEFPGIYQLYNHTDLIAQWAINVDPEESDVQALATGEIAQMEGQGTIFIIKKSDDLAAVVSSSRHGKELWKWCLLVALGLIILEMLLFRESSNPEILESSPSFEA